MAKGYKGTDNGPIPTGLRYNDFLTEITKVFPHARVLIDPEHGEVIVGTFFARTEGENVQPMEMPHYVGTPAALDAPLPLWQQEILYRRNRKTLD